MAANKRFACYGLIRDAECLNWTKKLHIAEPEFINLETHWWKRAGNERMCIKNELKHIKICIKARVDFNKTFPSPFHLALTSGFAEGVRRELCPHLSAGDECVWGRARGYLVMELVEIRPSGLPAWHTAETPPAVWWFAFGQTSGPPTSFGNTQQGRAAGNQSQRCWGTSA